MSRQPESESGISAKAKGRPASFRRGVTIVVLVLVLLLAAALLVNKVRGDSASDDAPSGGEPASAEDAPSGEPSDAEQPSTEPPAPVDVASPDDGPIEDIDAEQARVEQSVELVVQATNEIAERGDGAIEGLDAIATGFVLGELENLSREQAEQGYTQSGEAQIVSSELLTSDLEADPPHIVIGVCIDVSAITLTDANGDDVSDRLYNPGHPVRHEYGADFIDEVWKVSTHEIPAIQECPSPEES